MKTAIALAFIVTSAAMAQPPAFEVATIKPPSLVSPESSIRVTIDKNRVTLIYQSLSDILSLTYGVIPAQIVGPDYLKTEHFDILAKLPAGATEEQVPDMLRALLAERFGMVAHREKREAQIYALVVSKGGLKKMKPATEAELAPEPMEGDQTRNTPFGKMTIRQVNGKGGVAFHARSRHPEGDRWNQRRSAYRVI